MPRKRVFQHRKDKERKKRLQVHKSISPPPAHTFDFSTVPLPLGWTQHEANEKRVFCKLSQVSGNSATPVAVSHTVSVFADFSWVLHVYNNQVDRTTCEALKEFSPQLTPDRIPEVLKALDRLHVCAGQPDSHFIEMVEAKKERILSSHGETVAFLDSSPVELNGTTYPKTVRTSKCQKSLVILRNVILAKATETVSAQCTVVGQGSVLLQE